jgi:vancomycin resistance protein YoaR
MRPARWPWLLATVSVLLVFALAVWGPAREPARRLLFGVRPGVTLAGRPLGGMYPAEVLALLQEWARQAYRPPVNASIEQATGAILPERDGVQLDVQRTLDRVLAAGIGARLQPVFVAVPARWRADDLRRLTHLAGQYTTYAYGDPGRWSNIRKALGHLNNSLVFPGETFSFMAHMPPFTAAEGWKPAKVIIDGEPARGLGGGVCQVSSTLYNAVLRAKLQVVERHAHASRVPYVPPGCDATVAARPPLDLKFRNNTASPVLIRAALQGAAVRVALYTLPPST